jgi:hypothetical protein
MGEGGKISLVIWKGSRECWLVRERLNNTSLHFIKIFLGPALPKI